MSKSQKEAVDLDGIDPKIYARRWQILTTLCASLLVVMLANSSLNLALPAMALQLNLSSIEMTWVVNIYALIFASLLFTTSSMADRYGRKLIMQIGLAIFLTGTIYAGFFAGTGMEVVIARAIMGVGGAMVMPTTLSIINNVFPRDQRARAIAIWSGIAGGGIALGSVVSGFLLEHFDWQSVFVFSAIVGVVGLSFNQLLTPESRDEKQTPIDWIGGVLSTIGLLGLVYGITEAPDHGILAGDVLASLIVGLIGLGAFIWWQRRTPHPMLDMNLFKSSAFSVSALAVTLTFFALMGVFFSMSQLFQLVMGYGAMESALRMLPMTFLMILIAPVVPNIVKKFGSRWTVTSGLILVALAFVVMSRWPVVPEYWQVIASIMIMMFGMALTMTPATSMMMSAVPRNRSGMGSAMNDTTRQLGGAIGIAVLGAVIGSRYSSNIDSSLSQLPDQARLMAENSLASALNVASHAGPAADQIIEAAQAAWMSGLSTAMLIAAGIVSIAAIITAVWLPYSHQPNQDDTAIDPIVSE